MERTALDRRRAALILGAAALLAAVVAPASAMARTATRILVTSTKSSIVYTTDWSHEGTIPAAPVATARLQQKTRTGWKTLKGTVYVLRNDSSSASPTSFTQLGAFNTTTVRYALGTRGKYKFWFKGTSALAPSIAYATRRDFIGDHVELASVTATSTDGMWTTVALQYSVHWNQEAFTGAGSDGPLYLDFEGTFEDSGKTTYSGNIDMFQDIWDPQVIQVNYRVLNTYVTPILSAGTTYLDTTAYLKSADPYLFTSSSSIVRTEYPQLP